MASRGFCQRQKKKKNSRYANSNRSVQASLPLLAPRQRSRVLIESVPAMCIRFTVTILGGSNAKEAARALFLLVGRPIRQQDDIAHGLSRLMAPPVLFRHVAHRRHVELQLAALGDHRLLEATPDPREGCGVFVKHLRQFAADFECPYVTASFSGTELPHFQISRATCHIEQYNLTSRLVMPQSDCRSNGGTSAALAQFNVPQVARSRRPRSAASP